MKLLYVTTVGMTMRFFQPLIQNLLNSGNTVDIACNEETSEIPNCYRQWGCNVFPILWERSPFSYGNIKAIKQIQYIVSNGHYDIVHCHTPIAAACTRIACRSARKHGTKVLYTAHGFHFYKGAPIKNWLIYYPVEWICAHWTDTLITINKEDYALAQKHMHAKQVEYVPGVGIDTKRFKNTVVDRKVKRAEISVPDDAFLLFSVGELNRNKNHETVIRSLAQLNQKTIHYAIAGKGDLRIYLEELATELGVAEQVHLLGFRTDIAELYKAADVCCFPSIREGLGLAALEGMASGLPLIATDNRGVRDYAEDRVNAILCPPLDMHCFAKAVCTLADEPEKRQAWGQKNQIIAARFNNEVVLTEMERIYKEL